jgi:ADP-heptose:LPS heptosyltransferase
MTSSRVLVIHPGALGDVLQAVPALRALGRTGQAVLFAGQPRLGRLLAGLGVAHECTGFDGLGLQALFAEDAPLADLARRLAGVNRAVSWFAAGNPLYARRLRQVVADALVAPPVPPEPSRLTVWEHLLASLAPWGVTPAVAGAGAGAELPRATSASGEALRAPLAAPAPWRHRARGALAALGWEPARPLLLVHPGAGGAAKRWPAGKLAEALRRLGAGEPGRSRRGGAVPVPPGAARREIVVHQGPADAEAVEALQAHLGAALPTLVEPDLDVLAGALAESRAYLGGDSGVSHLAAAVGARAVILYPPATRERWAPWSPTAVSLAWTDDGTDIEAAVGALSG